MPKLITAAKTAAALAYAPAQPMRIQARPGSVAESRYYAKSALPQPWPASTRKPSAIVPGINPNVKEDLIFHGGKVVPQMEFQNVYLGGSASWAAQDVASIDSAIKLAMQDKRLNNVMLQYFPGVAMSCDVRDSFVLDEAKPTSLDEPDVQATVAALFDSALIKKSALESTLFNLILPRGTVLKLGTSSSTNGLGGYHGSTHIQRGGKTITLYYSANVYSEKQANGKESGIVAFDKPWKNVVATLYHEINEFRTDPDVNDAIINNSNDFLGWNARTGREVGDQPIFAATNLNQVFQEVKASTGRKRIPVQFMYSNAVHGPEGPINKPHA
jgi:hypothetical protein